MNAWSLAESQKHNQLHEELLICGFDYLHHEEETEIASCPEYFEYVSDRWRIVTIKGEVVWRELRDLGWEAWCDKMMEPCND